MTRLRLKGVEACHYVCCGDGSAPDYWTGVGPSPKLPAEACRFWRRWDLAPADAAVVATRGKRLLGFFRFYSEYRKEMLAAGTWVHPSLRGQGLALKLWTKALRLHRPKKVFVVAVTPGGEGLVTALKKAHPRIEFKP